MAEAQNTGLGTNELLMERDTATGSIEEVTEARLEELRKALGAEIGRLRLETRNWSLQTLADKAKLSERFMLSLELGESRASIETYIRLAKILQVTLPQFMSVLDPYCTTTETPLKHHAATLNEKIGSGLRKQRRKLGLSVATIESRSGIATGRIYHLEEGGGSDVYTMYSLAAANQMTLAQLFAVLDDHVEPETK